jgi:hypothetical protein
MAASDPLAFPGVRSIARRFRILVTGSALTRNPRVDVAGFECLH